MDSRVPQRSEERARLAIPAAYPLERSESCVPQRREMGSVSRSRTSGFEPDLEPLMDADRR
jgi:hypothetical protein